MRDHISVLRILRSRDEDRQLLVTGMDCAKQGHSATTPIKIHHREIELAASLTHNLQRIGDTSCRENNDSGPPKRFSQHSIEVLIARVEKNYPRFHPDPMLASTGRWL